MLPPMPGRAAPRQGRVVEPGVVRAVDKSRVVSGFGYQLRTGSDGSQESFMMSEPVERLDIFLSHSWRDSGFLKYLGEWISTAFRPSAHRFTRDARPLAIEGRPPPSSYLTWHVDQPQPTPPPLDTALCWHFNALLAVCAGLLSGLTVCAYQRTTGRLLTPAASFGNMVLDTLNTVEPLGFGWIRARVHEPWNDPEHGCRLTKICQPVGLITFLIVLLFGHHLTPKRRVFLDKICINQTVSQRT